VLKNTITDGKNLSLKKTTKSGHTIVVVESLLPVAIALGFLDYIAPEKNLLTAFAELTEMTLR
jgi:hypothetical protein